MSSTEVKFAVRGRVRALDEKTAREAYEFFRSRLGEPDDATTNHSGVDWFQYKAKSTGGWEVVGTEAGWRPGKWGVDYVILEGYEHNDPWPGRVAILDLATVVAQMQARFGIAAEDIFVTAYTWYNGVDEPIDLERPAALTGLTLR